MKKSIKRGLAIAAVAPLAVVGFAGQAGAVVVGPQNALLVTDDIIQFECWHPANSLNLGFQVRVFVEDFTDDYDFDDVTGVRVRASDDDGKGKYDNEDAHVSKVKVSLLQNYNVKASVTRSDHDFKSDGIRNFRIHKNNINQVRVQVWWSKAGEEGDPYTVACLANEAAIQDAL
jgi:hypothetical protein